MKTNDGVESGDQHMDKPKSEIEQRIFRLTLELHKRGHTRKEIVHHLREVADTTEDYWGDDDSWDMAPSEKDVALPGDFEDE